MRVTLDWLGVATFRLTIGNLVVFLDAYLDRVPAAPPVGLTTADIARADYVLVGHSHFDHLWGAERIAARTGAIVIGSHETVRLLHDVDRIPERQLIAVAGGEPIELPDGIRVRVLPSLHSCIWATMGGADEACLGDLGVAHQERVARVTQAMDLLHGGALGADVAAHMAASDRHPRGEGGSFAYLLETPAGSIFWKDTSGHWTSVLRELRPDVALLAAMGRGNVNGDPVQGTLAQFIMGLFVEIADLQGYPKQASGLRRLIPWRYSGRASTPFSMHARTLPQCSLGSTRLRDASDRANRSHA